MTSRSAGATEHGLAVPTTRFIGRRTDLENVRRRLAESRLVTLTGVGGVGKTRLAVELARTLGRAFPDGVRLIDLSAVGEAGRVAQAAVTSLAVIDRSTSTPESKLIGHLAGRQMLLILDNCEHVADECSALVEEILEHTEQVRVLATSRRTLGVRGEHLYPVRPLDAVDAMHLLVDRAQATQPEFAVTEENQAAAARLCVRLDGLPLAIELAGTRLRSLSLQELAERLENRFDLLTGPGTRPRQRTLRAVMDWSHSLCSPRQRLLWARLSVFAGNFDLRAAEAVCAGDGLPRDEVLEELDQLVAQSVVVAEPAGSTVRFRLLETIRQYGRERLAEIGELDKLRESHLDHYLATAQKVAAGWATPGQRAGLLRLRSEHANLRAALDYALAEATGGRRALELVTALRQLWYADAYLGEGREWLDRVLAAPPFTETPEDRRARADALWVAAWVTLLQGDHARAAARIEECESLAEKPGPDRAAGYASALRGTSLLFRNLLPQAQAAYEQAAEVFRAIGDTEGLLWTLFQLAITASHQGDSARAERICRESIGLSEATGERLCRSYALWVLAFDTWRRGDARRAEQIVGEALAGHRDFHDAVGVALLIELAAWIADTRGEPTRSARFLSVADAVWESIGTRLTAFGPPLQEHRLACEASLRSRLDPAARKPVRFTSVHDAIDAVLHPDPEPSTAKSKDVLTGRERQIAQLLADGLSNREIAAKLVISPRTVDGHVERILAKLGFTSRTQVAVWVARNG
ncbi:ATP-binding protein [Actinoplanes subtropicus]|uniref:ATP-binding protein n=1 Tax=Actinoplanes subtropicus TaxID=543632 RepID=UPI0004C30B3E|nr:LuxR C-terminal-related transcriptional regulator [Actinoplanes subtropicus]